MISFQFSANFKTQSNLFLAAKPVFFNFEKTINIFCVISDFIFIFTPCNFVHITNEILGQETFPFKKVYDYSNFIDI